MSTIAQTSTRLISVAGLPGAPGQAAHASTAAAATVASQYLIVRGIRASLPAATGSHVPG